MSQLNVTAECAFLNLHRHTERIIAMIITLINHILSYCTEIPNYN